MTTDLPLVWKRWYQQNAVLFWICVLIAVNQLGFGSIVPAVPLYARTFGVPQSAIGLTIAIYGLARFLWGVPAGNLADRLGRRPTLALGGLITTVGNLLCALAPTYVPFLVARFVAGTGAALVLTAAQIVLADISDPSRRGRLMAIYTGVFMFAVGAGPVPGGLLIERLGLNAPFYAYAVLGTAAAAVAWLAVPETRPALAKGAVGVASAAPSFALQLRLLSVNRGFLLVSLISFSAAFARTGALFNLIPVLGKERLLLSADQIGLGLGLISVMGLALTYPSGMLVDRFGRKPVIVPATLLTGAAFLLFLTATSYEGFLAGCVTWSVMTGLSGAAPAAYAADLAPAGMNAAAMGAYRTLSDLGYVAGPLLLGVLADILGMDAALLLTAAMLVAVALLFAWLAPETHPRARRRAA